MSNNKWVKPILPIIIGLVAFLVLIFVGDVIANARSEDAFGLAFQNLIGEDEGGIFAGRITWSIIGAIVVYLIYVFFADRPIWKVGTREVVFMAIGAVLYGVLSWTTNVTTIAVPSVSQVALRPAIAIPPLFGYLFGPVVGFFTGAFGNILGDAITGWGVFPQWDFGNGLLGMIPGLVFAVKDREKTLKTIAWVTAGLAALTAVIIWISPEKEFFGPFTWEEGNYGEYWWVMLVGAVLILLAYFLLKDRGEAGAVAVWSSLGIIVGLGFASISDIWINGYSFWVAMLGEFAPSAGPDIIFAVILVPILYVAYQAAVARGGR
jgi:uncharacterized membrane protein